MVTVPRPDLCPSNALVVVVVETSCYRCVNDVLVVEERPMFESDVEEVVGGGGLLVVARYVRNVIIYAHLTV